MDEFDNDWPLVDEAEKALRDVGRGSVSVVQRRLRIGYPRAMRIMEELEKRGVVGPHRAGELQEILPPKTEGSR